MAFAWHDHHFINGIPCLDFANTVVYRNRPDRRVDRLSSLDDLSAWQKAAGLPREAADLEQALELREAVDELFRRRSREGDFPPQALRKVALAYAVSLERDTPDALGAVAESALRLVFSGTAGRVKVCEGCAWLFLDRTRNGRKRWCITAMCGSRAKARRYYARRKNREGVFGED